VARVVELFAPSAGQGGKSGVGVFGDDAQKGHRRGVWPDAALLPVAQSDDGDAQRADELRLAHADARAYGGGGAIPR